MTFLLSVSLTLVILLAFWLEPVQRAEFDADYATVVKELEAMQLETRIIDTVLERTDNQQDLDNCE